MTISFNAQVRGGAESMRQFNEKTERCRVLFEVLGPTREQLQAEVELLTWLLDD